MEGFVFTSGQLGIDPATGTLCEGVEAQARQAFTNLKNVLDSANASMDDVLKTTVFMVDLADFPLMTHVNDVLEHGKDAELPWESFTFDNTR